MWFSIRAPRVQGNCVTLSPSRLGANLIGETVVTQHLAQVGRSVKRCAINGLTQRWPTQERFRGKCLPFRLGVILDLNPGRCLFTADSLLTVPTNDQGSSYNKLTALQKTPKFLPLFSIGKAWPLFLNRATLPSSGHLRHLQWHF